jgi:hypothetical protein
LNASMTTTPSKKPPPPNDPHRLAAFSHGSQCTNRLASGPCCKTPWNCAFPNSLPATILGNLLRRRFDLSTSSRRVSDPRPPSICRKPPRPSRRRQHLRKSNSLSFIGPQECAGRRHAAMLNDQPAPRPGCAATASGYQAAGYCRRIWPGGWNTNTKVGFAALGLPACRRG